MSKIESMREVYEKHINNQKRGYEITAKIVGHVIRRMQEACYISGDVQVTGRIKSFKSAYENTEKKKLDDCFGVRIVASDEDLTKIRQQLEKILVVTQTKDHRKKKDTKYNGIHQMVHIQKRYADSSGICFEQFPLVEIQYWSREIQRLCINGDLSYANYKRGDYRDFVEELEERGNNALGELPTYYEIIGNRMHKLSAKDTLLKLYPEIYSMKYRRKNNMIRLEER